MELIVGKKGAGKTKYLLNKMKKILDNNNLLNENLKSKIYIIVPNQYTNMYERFLVENLSRGTLMGVEVLSFSRLSNIILKGSKYNHYKYIDDLGKNMILLSILEKTNLKILKKDKNQIKSIAKNISKIKSYGTTPKEILNKLGDDVDEILKLKLLDLQNIFEQYEKFLNEGYMDEEDQIKNMFEIMKESNFFSGSYVFLEKFETLEKNQYEILEEIVKEAKNIYVSILSEDIKEEINDLDIFKDAKETAKNILNIFTEINIQKLKEGKSSSVKYIYLKNKANFSKEISIFEKEFPNIYSRKNNLNEEEIETKNGEIEDIKFISFENSFNEIDYIALDIVDKINKGYMPKDFLIISNNLIEDGENLKEGCKKFGIELNISIKKNLLKNVLVLYVLDLLKCSIYKKSEDILNLLKLGLININEDILEKLERYIIRWNISGYKWDLDWKNREDDIYFEDINKTRKKIVAKLNEFKEELISAKTGKDKIIIIYSYLEREKIIDKIFSEIDNEEIKSEYLACINILNDIFDELAYIYEKRDISVENLIYLLEDSFRENKLKEVPNLLNAVDVSDMSSGSSNKKIIYIMSSEDKLLPSKMDDLSIISDEEIEFLKGKDISFLKTKTEKTFSFEYKFYDAVFSAKDKIIFTYSKKDLIGKTKRRSIYFKKIQNIFPKFKEIEIVEENLKLSFLEKIKYLPIEKQKILLEEKVGKDYSKYLNKGNVLENDLNIIKYLKEKGIFEKEEKEIFLNNNENKLEKNVVKKIYGKTLKTSVSRLENYSKCPFMYHIKYIINANEKEEYRLKPFDTGNFIHKVLENFVNNISSYIEKIKIEMPSLPVYEIIDENNKKRYLQFLQKKIKLSIDETFKTKEFEIFNNDKKFQILSKKLFSILEKACTTIAESLRLSDFKVYKTEYEVNGKILENVIIKGKIDRIDVFEKDEKKYFRIIDYKSSKKTITPKEIYSGINIQMPVYASIIEKNNKDIKNAGLMYFVSDEKKINNKTENISENLRQILPMYKMDGIILEDQNLVKAMDKTISDENKLATFIPVKLKKDGEFSLSTKIISEESLEKLLEDIEKILEKTVTEIISGNIDIYPLEDACSYCKYQNICMIDKNKNKKRKYTKIDKWK